MKASRIEPEKITNTIQLMAAWFVAAVLFDGVILWAASIIEEPKWIPGFLCASAVVIAVIAMIAVFLMLTKFRPHLQGPKEYYRWLTDERKMVSTNTKGITTKDYVGRNKRLKNKSPELYMNEEISENLSKEIKLIKEMISQHIEINRIEDCDEVVGVLRRLGFHVSIYQKSWSTRDKDEYKLLEECESIWLGSKVSARIAVMAIKQVLRYWQHLKYIDLSEDHSTGPDYTHYEIFFGGATSTAKEWELKPWTNEEIFAIDDSINIEDFHRLIRSKYSDNQEMINKEDY